MLICATETFNCVVKLGRATLKFSDVPLQLDTLQDLIESSWPHFVVMRYSLLYCYGEKETIVADTAKLHELLNSPVESPHVFKLRKDCLGFSEYCDKKRAVEALNKLKVPSNDPTMISESNNMFALQNPEQWDEIIERESRAIQTELHRRQVISLSTGVSEYTKREFISPVLIGCLQVVNGITMMCEKKIVGTFGNGPVDYSLIYKNLNIVLTEAKKENLEGGLIQNLVQQEASHESLTFAILPTQCKVGEIPRIARKRKFDEILKALATLPSYGIVTNGNFWIFSQIVREPALNRCSIFKSSQQTLLLHAKDTEKETQLHQIKDIMRGVVAICLKQKEVIDNNEEIGQILSGNSFAIQLYESGLVESYESTKIPRTDREDVDIEQDEEEF